MARAAERLRRAALAAAALACGCHIGPTPPPKPKPVRGPADVVPSGAPGPAACAGVPVVTPAELATGAHAGERIAVDLVPHAATRCTLLACPHHPACCNACQGSYDYQLGHTLRIWLIGAGRCSGMDCNLRCDPFGRAPTHRYRFVGLNDFIPAGSGGAIWAVSRLRVERYCTLDGP